MVINHAGSNQRELRVVYYSQRFMEIYALQGLSLLLNRYMTLDDIRCQHPDAS